MFTSGLILYICKEIRLIITIPNVFYCTQFAIKIACCKDTLGILKSIFNKGKYMHSHSCFNH